MIVDARGADVGVTKPFLHLGDVRLMIERFGGGGSREPGKPKTYVQQAIADHGEEVWPLLQQEAIVFVCGKASRMAPEVRQAFIDLFVARTGAAVSDGKAWLAGLAANQRYLEDIWASATAFTSPTRSM